MTPPVFGVALPSSIGESRLLVPVLPLLPVLPPPEEPEVPVLVEPDEPPAGVLDESSSSPPHAARKAAALAVPAVAIKARRRLVLCRRTLDQ
jgi:hypothetical protein